MMSKRNGIVWGLLAIYAACLLLGILLAVGYA